MDLHRLDYLHTNRMVNDELIERTKCLMGIIRANDEDGDEEDDDNDYGNYGNYGDYGDYGDDEDEDDEKEKMEEEEEQWNGIFCSKLDYSLLRERNYLFE